MALVGSEGHVNPASQHSPGRAARQILERSRESIASHVRAVTHGMQADYLVFTSGGTESNQLALFGMAGHTPGAIAISAIEHPSVTAAAMELARRGWETLKLPVTSEGEIDLSIATDLIQERRPRFVSVMLANSETGVIQPIEELGALCQRTGVFLHVDAVQGLGKMDVDFRRLGAHLMTIAPHKYGGPLGIGALLVRYGTPIAPISFGGFQQKALRPGTESPMLAAAFDEATRLAIEELEQRREKWKFQALQLKQCLLQAAPDCVIHGALAPNRLPQTVCVSIPGIERQSLVLALDTEGVACSTGTACASGSSQPSPVLVAMGVEDPLVKSAVRFSLGPSTTDEEIGEACRRIASTINRLRKS